MANFNEHALEMSIMELFKERGTPMSAATRYIEKGQRFCLRTT